jgi:solute carrier family 6 GABA transporter-like protein 1
MALPIVFTIIILGRSVSLENAGRGIKLYFATWNGDQLARGQIWQTAVGQVFFSTGVAFGYYVSYASYNDKFANAVQDAVIIVLFNCSFEVIAAFAVFGVVGYLGIDPSNTPRLGGEAWGGSLAARAFSLPEFTRCRMSTDLPSPNATAFEIGFLT